MVSPRQRFARELWTLADLEAAASARRSFRSRAYRQAVWSLDDVPPDLDAPAEELLAVPGIGEGVVGLIRDFRESGSIQRLEELRSGLPVAAAELRRLPRMNPDMLRKLKTQLEVETVADLEAALETGAVETVPGVGPSTVAVWLDRIERELALAGIPIPRALSFGLQLRDHVTRHVPGVELAVSGAVARLDDRVDAIELAGSPEETGRFLATSALVCDYEPGTARFLTLGGAVVIRSPAEELPVAGVTVEDLRGDMHRHSEWSPDGHDSIASIVDGAIRRGLEYVAITDHAVDLAFGGLSPDDLARQQDEIEALARDRPGFLILQGAELNIGRDGSVDYSDDILERLDFRLAAVHSYFDLPEPEQTERVLAAIHCPRIHAIGHLTGRRIGYRPPIRLDMRPVLEAAAATSTALEVNGHIDRLDLSAEFIPLAADLGAVFIANSDAHRHREWGNLANAVTVLRKAGVAPDQVVNTWPVERLQRWLARS
ncbi:MAG TPA: PHP domain-containing protein [Acidimicrobiia bacterium]|nr:PHP domain-containing protein [Acidimicrobiia bacterium]